MKGKKLVFVIIGIIAIVLAIICATASVGYYESSKTYGGDAYTGIQQAAAQTANNVQYLAEIVRFGFSAVLAVTGLISMAYGLFCKPVDYTRELEEINRNLRALKVEEKPEVKPEPEIAVSETAVEAPVAEIE